jgi:phosphatidylglycerophosphatase C
MKQTIAAFDFDGTITKKDMFFSYLIFCFSFPKLCLLSIPLLPVLFKNAFRIYDNGKAKEKIFTRFFKDWPLEMFKTKATEFTWTVIDQSIRPEMQEKIAWHKKQGHKLVLVSSNFDLLIWPWARDNGFQMIATKLEVIDEAITGKFSSENCYGLEKVRRFLEIFPNRPDYELYYYGDGRGDLEMLILADHKFKRNFL